MGRPHRDEDAGGGPQRIVAGMQAAIRCLHTAKLSRKDIAEHAGVTPPLVTYYFPDRDVLLAAAIMPVVKAMAEELDACLADTGPFERTLLRAVEVLLGHLGRDGAIIDVCDDLRAGSAKLGCEALDRVDEAIRAFFERSLPDRGDAKHRARFLQETMIAMCKVATRSPDEPGRSELVYRMLLRAVEDGCECASADLARPAAGPVALGWRRMARRLGDLLER